MNTRAILLLAATLTLSNAPLTHAASNSPKPQPPLQLRVQSTTPEFDRFLVRLQTCKGVIVALSQWVRVLKPTLQELGYSDEQIRHIKTALSKSTVTLADAEFFSERWLAKHHEQVRPGTIYEFLHHGKAASETIELAAK